METINAFNEQQKKVEEILKQMQGFVEKGKELGMDIGDDSLKKIEKAIEKNKNEKLKVALVGGFSEGKTSIAAAWLEDYDKSKMKIAMTESTDDVREYDIGNLHLVDTPGLFGFKETVNKEKYKDITKKYVSEANIVLYVMNSDNPIKESHKEELTWLFKELNLLERTIFILSRFDMVADVEDEEEYQNKLKIKKDNVLKRLQDFDIIKSGDVLPIIAVAANPFDMGIEYWLEHLDNFKKLSHIDALQKATTKLIAENGGVDKIIVETQKSIMTDILKKNMPNAENEFEKIDSEEKELKDILRDTGNDFNEIRERIYKVKRNLKNYIIELFKDLKLQVKGTSIETFENFFEERIGEEGNVLNNDISNYFSNEILSVGVEIDKMEKNFDTDIQNYHIVSDDASINGYKTGGAITKQVSSKVASKISGGTIIAIRDFLHISFKFKPWQALKIAKILKNGLPVVGELVNIGMEMLDSYNRSKNEAEFEKAKKEIYEDLEKQRKQYIEFLENEEEFDKKAFAGYYTMKEKIQSMENKINEKSSDLNELGSWINQGKKLEEQLKNYCA